MIEPTSLRLGNLVYKSLKSGQGRTNICAIDIYELIRIVEDTGSFNYKPIPLTEELLLRFGFVRSQTQDKFFTIEDSIGISTADDQFRFIKGNFVCQLVLAKIKYVHQLQNLFYALTNQELKLEGL